ncbi:AraC-like DNA-binding protein [Bradyrhizobium sp. USDA 4354]
MNPAQRALWYIESHLAEPMTLDEIAEISGVSRFHIVRAFAAATGLPVMRYVRARRLTEAARSLAKGAPDILSLALEADYGSHEAFTRAFRDHFGTTPEAVRAATCVSHLKLQEPILMDSTMLDHLAPTAFRDRKGVPHRRSRRAHLLRQRRHDPRSVAPLPSGGRRHPRPHR